MAQAMWYSTQLLTSYRNNVITSNNKLAPAHFKYFNKNIFSMCFRVEFSFNCVPLCQNTTMYIYHRASNSNPAHLSPLQRLAHRLKLSGAVSAGHADGVYRRSRGKRYRQRGLQWLEQLGLGLWRPSVNPFLVAPRMVAPAGIHECRYTSDTWEQDRTMTGGYNFTSSDY